MAENSNPQIDNQKKEIVRDTWYMHLAQFFDTLTYSMFRNYKNVFDNKFISRTKSIELAIKVLLVVLVFLMVIISVLAGALVSSTKNKTVQINVPEIVTSGIYTVKKNTASDTYFELIAKGFVTTATNYNHMNIEEKVNSLLPSILPATYTKTFTQIKNNVQFVVNNKVTQTYRIQSFKTIVKGNRAQVVFKGILNRKVGGLTTVENKPYEIPIIVKMIEYTPYIESFDFKYVGVRKADKEKEIALERESEIKLREKLLEEQKKNKESAYKRRQAEKKKKGEF